MILKNRAFSYLKAASIDLVDQYFFTDIFS